MKIYYKIIRYSIIFFLIVFNLAILIDVQNPLLNLLVFLLTLVFFGILTFFDIRWKHTIEWIDFIEDEVIFHLMTNRTIRMSKEDLLYIYDNFPAYKLVTVNSIKYFYYYGNGKLKTMGYLFKNNAKKDCVINKNNFPNSTFKYSAWM